MDTELDWRLNAFDFLADDWLNLWTGQNVLKGTRLTVSSCMKLTREKKLTISIPNATAILLNAAKRSYELAQVLRKNSNIDGSIKKNVSFTDEKSSFDYIEAKIESIIMAYTALEAFANEYISDDFKYERTKKDGTKEILDKEKIERYIPLNEKFSVILPEIFSIESPKGNNYWNSYVNLEKTRNRLIHMKSTDRRSTGPEKETLWHILFLQNAPHKVAKDIMGYFIDTMPKKPRWYSECPF